MLPAWNTKPNTWTEMKVGVLESSDWPASVDDFPIVTGSMVWYTVCPRVCSYLSRWILHMSWWSSQPILIVDLLVLKKTLHLGPASGVWRFFNFTAVLYLACRCCDRYILSRRDVIAGSIVGGLAGILICCICPIVIVGVWIWRQRRDNKHAPNNQPTSYQLLYLYQPNVPRNTKTFQPNLNTAVVYCPPAVSTAPQISNDS